MSEWKVFKMGQVARFLNGRAYKATEFKEVGTPIVRIQNLTGIGNTVYSDLELEENKYIDKGDLIYAWSATFGPYIWKGSKSIYHYHIWKILCDQLLLNKKYFYYHLLNVSDQLKDQGNGTLFIHITKELMEGFEIKLPPLPEQESIAEVLSSLDDKIDLLHRNNKTLEQLAQTLYRQWFVEEADDSWEDKKLIDIAFINPESLKKNHAHEVINYLDTGSITKGFISGYQSLSKLDAPSRAQRVVKKNDIIYSLVRPIQRHYGILDDVKNNTIVSTGFCVVRSKKISPLFLYLTLTQDDVIDYFDSVAEGSTTTYPSLRPEDLSNYSIGIPPENKLVRFDALATEVWTKIHKNYSQIKQLESLRDTLLPKLMSGAVRVIN